MGYLGPTAIYLAIKWRYEKDVVVLEEIKITLMHRETLWKWN